MAGVLVVVAGRVVGVEVVVGGTLMEMVMVVVLGGRVAVPVVTDRAGDREGGDVGSRGGSRGGARRGRRRRLRDDENSECLLWDDEGRQVVPLGVDCDPRRHRTRGYSPGGFATYPDAPTVVRIAGNL